MGGTPKTGSPGGGTTPTKDYGASLFLSNQTGVIDPWDTNGGQSTQQPRRDSLTLRVGTNPFAATIDPPARGGPVLVRKVTRTSPDSEDSDTEPEHQDDAFLISDRNESRYYGSAVHSGGPPKLNLWEKTLR